MQITLTIELEFTKDTTAKTTHMVANLMERLLADQDLLRQLEVAAESILTTELFECGCDVSTDVNVHAATPISELHAAVQQYIDNPR